VVRGHAIEARIYAEDPDKNFMPSPGRITHWRAPGGPGVRVDAGVEAGSAVPMHYDPMVAKLVVWGRDRNEALRRLRAALTEFVIGGIRTSLPFHLRALETAAFSSGEYDTGFVESSLADAAPVDAETHAFAVRAAALELSALDSAAPLVLTRKGQPDNRVSVEWPAADAPHGRTRVDVDGTLHALDARRLSPGLWSIVDDGVQLEVLIETRGSSGVEVVARGARHVLKWKAG
jgi:acetyl/propionyl-CoA carboxylase alpha subunit